ncbi:MAG: hypothetical protein R3Y32_02830 [Bacillota bacterium]
MVFSWFLAVKNTSRAKDCSVFARLFFFLSVIFICKIALFFLREHNIYIFGKRTSICILQFFRTVGLVGFVGFVDFEGIVFENESGFLFLPPRLYKGKTSPLTA